MNFLAHTYFAAGDPAKIVGQILGDFVRGRDLSAWPRPVASGITDHRAIDSYTDRHPLTQRARDLFEPPVRRYAGIVVDVVYDHFLAINWSHYHDEPLADYVQQIEAAIALHRHGLPKQLLRFAKFMHDNEVLTGNTQRQQIDLTLYRLSKRAKHLRPLAVAPQPLWQHVEELAAIFDEFFPLLQAHVKSRAEQP